MALQEHRPFGALSHSLSDLFDRPMPPALAPFGGRRAPAFRVEEYTTEERLVIRAELPGLDPHHDVEVTVADSTLTIHAVRHEEHRETHRSELRYGSMTRSLKLPPEADTENVTARYSRGVLEITMPLTAPRPRSRRVTVET